MVFVTDEIEILVENAKTSSQGIACLALTKSVKKKEKVWLADIK